MQTQRLSALVRHPSALRRRARRAGMTLMEIMIVIAILGVLMTTVVIGLSGAKDDADSMLTETTIRQLEQPLLRYSLKHKGKYPSTSEGLAAAFGKEKVPTDAWGNEFIYVSPGAHGDHPYEVTSLGKDGKEGGDAENADIHSWEMD